jgi:hypothetical protein
MSHHSSLHLTVLKLHFHHNFRTAFVEEKENSIFPSYIDSKARSSKPKKSLTVFFLYLLFHHAFKFYKQKKDHLLSSGKTIAFFCVSFACYFSVPFRPQTQTDSYRWSMTRKKSKVSKKK